MNRLTVLFTSAALMLAQKAQPALKPIDGDLHPSDHKSTVIFKTTPQGDLKMNLYFPKDWKPGDRRPGIVFFFVGGFVGGSPRQFAHTAEYFAGRGMVAASSEYRIRNIHHTEAQKSIEDAKSAVRWLRMNARELGIDPNRIVAGGGSAGGTCAALAAYNSTFEPEGEDKTISSEPNALVLYNPALGFGRNFNQAKPEQIRTLEPVISAWSVRKGGPPAILFYGTADELQETGRAFVEQMIAAGNRAELYTAAGQKHGFFNERGIAAGVGPWHELVLQQTDRFLSSLGYLDGPPEIAPPPGTTAALERELPQ